MAKRREKEWGVVIAREVAAVIPEAVQQVPGLRLTEHQIAALQRAVQKRLIETMGEDETEAHGVERP
jgi:hypothetical protein